MNLRVAHLIGGLFYGGGQRVVYDLLQESVEGLEQDLWLLGDQGHTRLNRMASVVFRYDGRYNRFATLRGVAKQIRAWAKEHPIDILHSHGMDADLLGAWAIGATGILHISHLHSMPNSRATSWRAWLRIQLYAWLTKRAQTRFVAVSEAVKRANAACYGFSENLITTIPNGVSWLEFGSAMRMRNAGQPMVFGFAGRLVEIKGVDYLIDAVQLLHAQNLNFHLLLAGTGNREQHLRNRVQQSGLGTKVQFLGNVEDMRGFYQQIDVLVLPSLSEGMPLVVLEAMASGLPVIATDVGGTGELIRPNSDGWLVPAQDGKSLAVAMRKALECQDLRLFGEAGAKKVRTDYSLELVRQRLHALYRESHPFWKAI